MRKRNLRLFIYLLRLRGLKYRQIGCIVGRHPSNVCRQLRMITAEDRALISPPASNSVEEARLD